MLKVMEREELLASALRSLNEPCAECSHAKLCETGYACQAFREWVHLGKVSDDSKYIPQQKIYQKLFGGPKALSKSRSHGMKRDTIAKVSNDNRNDDD